MGRLAEEYSLRTETGTIRHLDPVRARSLVGLYHQPVTSDGDGLVDRSHDTLVAGTFGHLMLDHAAATEEPGVTDPTRLGHYKTHLYLHGLQRLPLSVARELARHRGHLYLDGLERITDSVAECLAGSVGGGLSFNGVRWLSMNAAWHLGAHPGELSFNKVAYLSPPMAVGLARNTHELYLEGLESLPSEVAAALSLHRGDLHLGGSFSLEAASARHLARHPGRLHVHDVSVLGTGAAAAFGERTGHLCLRELRLLPLQQAIHFSHHTGPLILQSLNVERLAAEALGRHEGSLLVRVDDDQDGSTITPLLQHRGPLALLGLRQVDAARARLLAAQSPVGGFEGLSSLFLDDVEQLSTEAAAILATHKAGGLSLNKLPLLSEAQAERLIAHPNLSLNGIRTVTDRVATILAKDAGVSLSLVGLKAASPSGIERLRANSRIILPRRMQDPMGPQTRPIDPAAQARLAAAIKRIAAQGEEQIAQGAARRVR
jgi:hypothetical protein